jgi:hypothetical protein
MKTIYTVYQLNEKLNKVGNPYIGYSQDLITRSRQWKSILKLDYKPKLIPLYVTSEEKDAFNWEQPIRIQLGWGVERCTFEQLVKMRKAAQKANKKNYVLRTHRKTRLSESQRLQIGRLYYTIDGITGKIWDKDSLAKNYNVTKCTINSILKKQNLLKKRKKGDIHRCHKLSKNQAIEIRRLFNCKDEQGRKYNATYLSKIYKVNQNIIAEVIKDKFTDYTLTSTS